jgi:hypothetical protein
MPQDLFDDTFILNEADDAHRSLAFRAKKGIDVIYFLDQSRPIFAELFC